MVILGLDPGIAATGYGLVETRGSVLATIASGVIVTSPRAEPAARLARIHHAIAELVAGHAPDCAAVEELYVGPNPRGILAVGQARGAALSACGAAGLSVHEYPVATIKVAVCGYGRAGKDQVLRMSRAILALPAIANEHEADALAAAICHASHSRTPALAGRPA